MATQSKATHTIIGQKPVNKVEWEVREFFFRNMVTAYFDDLMRRQNLFLSLEGLLPGVEGETIEITIRKLDTDRQKFSRLPDSYLDRLWKDLSHRSLFAA